MLIPAHALPCRARLWLLIAGAAIAGCATPAGRVQQREEAAALDMAAYRARAPEVSGALTLPQAQELASRHNIEVWIAEQERQIQHELATQSLLNLLPSLMAGTDSSWRSRLDASSSISYDRGQESLEPSYSSDRSRHTSEISLTWDVLDFGLSLFRARQQANRESITWERERRVRQNLALEVARAYWQALTARATAVEAEKLGVEVSDALARIGQQIQEQTVSELDGLKVQTRLLEQQEELRRYKRAYLTARTELATLMGLAPGTPIELAPVELVALPAAGPIDVETLELEALRHRPELFEKDREEEIARDEAYVALAQMLPHLSLYWRWDRDDNRFLLFNEWNTVGLHAAWDLLTIPQQLLQHNAMKLQQELVARQRTAQAVAILTQLHLALIDCDEAAAQLQISTQIAEQHRRLVLAVESAAQEGKSHGGEALDQRMKSLRAEARRLSAYAELMVARARLDNTTGRNLAPAGPAPPDPDTAAPPKP